MIYQRVDETALGIDKKLARKYNAIVNFAKKNTVYEDGAVVALIENIEYHRRPSREKLFSTNDHIKMTVKVFDRQYILWVNNPKALSIDRKYNCITMVEHLVVEEV